MNKTILKIFFDFMKKVPSNCLGHCSLYSSQFIIHLSQHVKDYNLQVLDKFEILLSSKNNDIKCSVKMVETIALFNSYDSFCKHTNKLYINRKNINGKIEDTYEISLKSKYGKLFNYSANGVLIDTTTTQFGVGYSHFVVLVTSQDNMYILDSTLNQFDGNLAGLILV